MTEMLQHAALQGEGYLVLPPILDAEDLAMLRSACESLQPSGTRRRAGLRGVLRTSEILRKFCQGQFVRSLVEPILGPGAFPTRSILFDKSPAANWDVVWHQDTTIAVRECCDVPGFGPWSIKEGIPHVQPPAAVLEEMLTVRIHIDDCSESNGPLLVAPGSHTRGIIPDGEINAEACDGAAVPCLAEAGGVILMRPLILHASRKAERPSRRRVLHLEYASQPLPGNLEWAQV